MKKATLVILYLSFPNESLASIITAGSAVHDVSERATRITA